MATVTVIEDGKPRQAEGRTVEAIARREFGRAATLRREHDPAFDPAVDTFMVVRTDQHGTHVLGRIVAEPARGRGRPAVGTRVHVHIPKNLLAAVAREAKARGVTRADFIRQAVTAAVALSREESQS